MPRFASLLILSTTCLALSAGSLQAQDAESRPWDAAREGETQQEPNQAREYLQASRQRLVDAGVFSAQVELVTEMEQRFSDMMPSASGHYRAAVKTAGEASPWKVRITGSGKPFGRPDMNSFDVLWVDGRITTVEDDDKKVIEGPAGSVRGISFSQVRSLIGIPGLTDGQAPYSVALDNQQAEFTLVDQQTYDGVTCHIIQVSSRQGQATIHHTIALGTDDLLPRRITLHPRGFDTPNAMGASFTQVSLDPERLATETWEIATPDGYEREVIETPAPPTRAAQRNRPDAQSPTTDATRLGTQGEEGEAAGDNEEEGNSGARKVTPSMAASPKWSMKDAQGTVVSNETLRGHVSVLYFWGTWCIPCRRAAPLNIELFEEMSENPNFKMVGMAVRERDPKAAYTYASENGHNWTQLVGAEDPAKLFGVERYPTWIVVGHEGQILYTSGRPEGGDFAPIFGEIRAAVKKGLEGISRGKN